MHVYIYMYMYMYMYTYKSCKCVHTYFRKYVRTNKHTYLHCNLWCQPRQLEDKQRPRHVHMLNATLAASGRCLCCLLDSEPHFRHGSFIPFFACNVSGAAMLQQQETYQTAEGSAPTDPLQLQL